MTTAIKNTMYHLTLRFAHHINKKNTAKKAAEILARFLAYALLKNNNIHQKIIPTANNAGIEFSFGYLYWFISVKTVLPTPNFNIFQLIPEKYKKDVIEILKPYKENRNIKKQILMLKSNAITTETKKYAEDILVDILSSRLHDKEENQTAIKTLIETKIFIEGLGIRPFAISGTALGLIREGKILAHDYDIDIGVFSEEIKGKHFYEKISKWKSAKYAEVSEHLIRIKHKNKITIDIFVHHKERNSIWHGTDTHRWYNSAFDLKRYQIENDYIYVPSDGNQYLTENYGHWKDRSLFFDYSFDTPNRTYPQTNRAILYLINRIDNEMRKKKPDRYTVEQCIKNLENYYSIKNK